MTAAGVALALTETVAASPLPRTTAREPFPV
jgi:hypothetical protein